jgi:hypothetical protein
MMNIFYHDRIALGLDASEDALSQLRHADAKNALDALAEVRRLVETTRELSKHAEGIWNECARDIGQDGPLGAAPINPRTGNPYTYVDQWAARYELIRREINRKLDSGYSIGLIKPIE